MLEFVSSFPFEFYKTTYVSYLASDRQFYIRMDQLCEGIGLDYSSQLRRVKEDEAPPPSTLHARASGRRCEKADRHYRAHPRLVSHLADGGLRGLCRPCTRAGSPVGAGELRCHPNCGVGTALMINKESKEWAPVPQFLDIPQLIKDMQGITDAGRGKTFSNMMMGLALLKNYKPMRAPKSLALIDLLKKFDKSFALTGEARARKKYGASDPDRTIEDAMKRRSDPWNFLFIAGMWFQDLFNYDFRRTEMCIIPYATQQGEISFCAYNTGIGWRKILENMYKNASVAEWYKTHGKHAIYAKGKSVELDTKQHSLTVNAGDAARVRNLESETPRRSAQRPHHRAAPAAPERRDRSLAPQRDALRSQAEGCSLQERSRSTKHGWERRAASRRPPPSSGRPRGPDRSTVPRGTGAAPSV